ncbi:hypothetical protein [Zunongwangia sp. HRR-M8]|uniref:hypothetical protein n=1 Tax=Zunongwangia sp. HRR-M8 TaxID=3015170 RepID=UPI0022DD2E76|nr:hypothetical protein [Zunongwangia sp. HRR-M8]WBL20787.1 hypothetical protein PBT89_08570 [Zunongwangia sp. HRR-M8]
MNNYLDKIQNILYLGYIFLIFLGIINETLFYSQFGINILEYSDILDVLISPISKLSSNVSLLIISSFVILILIAVPKMSRKLKDKKWFTSFLKLDPSETNIEKKVFEGLTVFSIIFFIGIFVGAGYGKALRLKQKIESREVKYTNQINFLDGELLDVKLIGKNSSYVFYLIEGDTEVKISPINGTIKYLSN